MVLPFSDPTSGPKIRSAATSHDQLLLVFLLLYGCTVVQDQCTIGTALYYCITSLLVYLNTVHGQCTTVVLDVHDLKTQILDSGHNPCHHMTLVGF